MKIRLIDSMLKQSACLWSRTGTGGYGQDLFGYPEEVNVRWEGKLQEVVNAQGQDTVSRAQVFSQTVINPGDYLYEGTLAELETLMVSKSATVTAEPVSCPEAYKVINYSNNPTYRGDQRLRIAYL